MSVDDCSSSAVASAFRPAMATFSCINCPAAPPCGPCRGPFAAIRLAAGVLAASEGSDVPADRSEPGRSVVSSRALRWLTNTAPWCVCGGLAWQCNARPTVCGHRRGPTTHCPAPALPDPSRRWLKEPGVLCWLELRHAAMQHVHDVAQCHTRCSTYTMWHIHAAVITLGLHQASCIA